MSAGFAEPSDRTHRPARDLAGDEGEPAREGSAPHRDVDVDQLDLFLQDAAGVVPARPSELAHHGGAAAGPSAGSRADEDWERFQASLRWLRSETRACRLPPATPLPPVPGLPPVAPAVEFNRPPLRFRAAAPPSLAPDQVGLRLERAPSGLLRAVAKLLLASAVAASVAYFVTIRTAPMPARMASAADDMRVAMQSRPSETVARPATEPESQSPVRPVADRDSRSAEAAPQGPAEPVVAESRPQAAVIAPTATADPPAPAAAEPVAAESRGVAPPDAVPVKVAVVSAADTPPGAGAGSAAPFPAGPARVGLDTAEMRVLIERGRQFFESGDVAAARVLFRRAAEAGDATAALAMGATYDPVVLGQHGVRGLTPDIAKARDWYEKARLLGSPEGPRRLEMLANR